MKIRQWVRGDTKVLTFRIKQGNEYLDLSGGVLFFTGKTNEKDSDENAVIAKATNCTGESASIYLSHEDTKNLLGEIYCDIQFVGAEGDPVLSDVGIIKFIRDITQRVTA